MLIFRVFLAEFLMLIATKFLKFATECMGNILLMPSHTAFQMRSRTFNSLHNHTKFTLMKTPIQSAATPLGIVPKVPEVTAATEVSPSTQLSAAKLAKLASGTQTMGPMPKEFAKLNKSIKERRKRLSYKQKVAEIKPPPPKKKQQQQQQQETQGHQKAEEEAQGPQAQRCCV